MIYMCLRFLRMFSLLLALGSALIGQSGEMREQSDEELLNGYELRLGGKLFREAATKRSAVFAAQLPLRSIVKAARLVGVFDFDGDGRQEVFLAWTTPLRNLSAHHFQIYRLQGQKAALLSQFTLAGGAQASITFYQPATKADTPKTVFEVMGGAKWSTFYLLGPDGKSARELGSGTNYAFIDLEKTGVYNLVIYRERPFEPVCPFLGYMSLNPGLFPEVFSKKGAGYSKVWPPAGWLPYDFRLLDQLRHNPAPLLGRHYVVMAEIYDIARDGAAQIAALTDTVQMGNNKRMLQVYKMSGGALTLQSQLAVAHPDMAVVLYGMRRLRHTTQAVLFFADPKSCAAPNPPVAGPSLSRAAGFDFRQEKFAPVWQRKFDQFYPYLPAALTDVDHTGEEEMTLPDQNGTPVITLRKESEFIPPPPKVLCAIGCPPFCSDAPNKRPACAAAADPPH